jgi:hypothetical protein
VNDEKVKADEDTIPIEKTVNLMNLEELIIRFLMR